MSASQAILPPDRERPGCRALFQGFARIGISGFGGVLPFARRYLVDRYSWLNAEEFNSLLGLCQLLPGPNITNLAVYFGARCRGWRGALAAILGLLLPPMAVVFVLGLVWARMAAHPAVAGALHGMAAAGAGLIFATGLRMAWVYRQTWQSLLLFAAVFVAIGLLRWPMLPVLAALFFLGVALHARSSPHQD